MTERAPERIWSGIDIGKTIAGTLAAVSAAVIGSFLGVAGTLIGAAVASIVGSVGTEIYSRFIKHSSTKIKSTFVTAPAAVGTPPVAAAEEETPSQPEPATQGRLRWGRVAAVAASLFVLAIGSLTVFELIAQRSVADAVGHKTSQSTTLGSAFSGKSDKQEEQRPAPTTSSEAPAQDDGTEPTQAPTSTSPEPGASTAPTDQPDATTQPTDSPTTGAPADDPGDGDGGDQGTTGGPGSGSGGNGGAGDSTDGTGGGARMGGDTSTGGAE